jgi:hypothetical protein
VNETCFLGFFDELSKIAADFKFLGSTAQGYAKTLKGIKSGAGSAVENAAFKAQNITKDLRTLRTQQAGATKLKARSLTGAGAFATPQTGRAQHILDKMKARVNPALSSPQVQQARQAEQQARTGALGAAPKMRVL